MAELNEDPLAPDWGQIDQGNKRAVADALFLIWALFNNQKIVFPGGSSVFLNGDGIFIVPGSFSRVVGAGETMTINDRFSVVVMDYFAIEGSGTLVLAGDAALGVL